MKIESLLREEPPGRMRQGRARRAMLMPWPLGKGRPTTSRKQRARVCALEPLEGRTLLDASAPVAPASAAAQVHTAADPQLTPSEVKALLDRASGASSSRDAIIAVVDRGGHILGVRVEDGVSPTITGNVANLTFAIDGAVAEARTAAFFANDNAPLTSRTIQDISQSTMTQRE